MMNDLADPDELNEIIACLAREMGCPHYIHPAHVRPGDVPPEYRGLITDKGDGPTLYREGHRWRERVLAELEQRPERVAEWRSAQELDAAIEALCKAKGLRFHPHETMPWNAPDELPDDYNVNGAGWYNSLPQAVKLRRKLIAELEGRG
jgi:hypothetical protein